MEYIYNFRNSRMTLDEFKDDIINDYINTNKSKKDLKKTYPVSTVTLGKVLKGVKKKYSECLICGDKNRENFYETNKSQCKTCVSYSNKIHYTNLPEDKKIEKINKQKKWISNNLIKVRVLAAKHRATRKKINFDIDEQFITELLIKQNYKCNYSGIILDITNLNDKLKNINPNTISIERIDSNKGYTKDNVVLVAGIVNTMKNDLSQDEFIKTINLICKNFLENF